MEKKKLLFVILVMAVVVLILATVDNLSISQKLINLYRYKSNHNFTSVANTRSYMNMSTLDEMSRDYISKDVNVDTLIQGKIRQLDNYEQKDQSGDPKRRYEAHDGRAFPLHSAAAVNEKCKRRFPGALVTGFGHCGTGTIMKFLDIHPQISAVLKPVEVWFFVGRSYSKGEEFYRSRMTCSFSDQITIEKSPGYSWKPEVPERVHRFNSSIKLIFMVRDPVKRVISHYALGWNAKIAKNMTPTPLSSKVLLPNGEVNPRDYWVNISRYYVNLQRWLKYFNFSQILIVDGESFASYPVPELKRIEKFLGLQPYIEDKHFVLNKTKGFYCVRDQDTVDLISCMGNKGHKHPQIEQPLLRKLYAFFRDENEQFFSLIGRRFNWTYIE